MPYKHIYYKIEHCKQLSKSTVETPTEAMDPNQGTTDDDYGTYFAANFMACMQV